MQINLEPADKHSIRAYTQTEVQISENVYQQSLIISADELITDWPVYSTEMLNESAISPMLKFHPEVILIGSEQSGARIPLPLIQYLSTYRIGIECMSIGAASRTFNILLNERRAVVAGIIFLKRA